MRLQGCVQDNLNLAKGITGELNLPCTYEMDSSLGCFIPEKEGNISKFF